MATADQLVEYGAPRIIITITAVCCALLEIIDITIVNVALNDMRGNLGSQGESGGRRGQDGDETLG